MSRTPVFLRCCLLALLIVGVTLRDRAAAAPPEAVLQQSINRGVQYLRSQQAHDGQWGYSGQSAFGPTALAALTLLECGAKPNDLAVTKAADVIRRASETLGDTYTLALAIMFLDRVGDPADLPILQTLGCRLLAGQNAQGGWSYQCPVLGDVAEMRRRSQEIRERQLRTEGMPAEKPDKTDKDKEKPKEKPRPPLSESLQAIVVALRQQHAAGVFHAQAAGGDNSNTQFAILGLWVARRHGVPVRDVLDRSAERFRLSQNPDGGWGYMAGIGAGPRVGGDSSPAMTCAGLLALAVGYGVYNESAIRTQEAARQEGKSEAKIRKPLDPRTDPVVKTGLMALSTVIGVPVGYNNLRNLPAMPQLNSGYYFLWSLERVAMVYSLQTIGRKDWYSWGCELLLLNQAPDGGWHGQYGQAGIDTCFALLFLRRSNLALDLTSALRGKTGDPAEVTLRSGGVGGADLKAKGLRSPFEPGASAAGPGPATPEADALAQKLVKARGEERKALLQKLKEGQESTHTFALARAIPQLEEGAQREAREALAYHIADRRVPWIVKWLKDDDAELRRAAALACAMRAEKNTIPELIPLLQDADFRVSRAAYAALKDLSEQDFGPPATANDKERQQAAELWKRWWEKQARR